MKRTILLTAFVAILSGSPALAQQITPVPSGGQDDTNMTQGNDENQQGTNGGESGDQAGEGSGTPSGGENAGKTGDGN